MRFFDSFDGEISMSDFTPEEWEEIARLYETDAEAFKRKYKEFYTDIKIDRHEDW